MGMKSTHVNDPDNAVTMCAYLHLEFRRFSLTFVSTVCYDALVLNSRFCPFTNIDAY